ncbi:MAG: lipoprotein signal peptidase [Ginsengibacter sp.]
MKGRTIFFIILLIVLADQALKVYIKTNYYVGETHTVIGQWFRIYFIENEGMAYGWKFGGEWGKMILTLFRLGAVIFGVFYIRSLTKNQYHKGFIICVGLIFAGALGNLIDSMFYGLIFEASSMETFNVAKMFPAGGGYAGFLHGNVVDMFYFPIIRDATIPAWIPFWGGENFEFFRPIFNIADASISTGIIAILVFQKRFFKDQPGKNADMEEAKVAVDNKNTVSTL